MRSDWEAEAQRLGYPGEKEMWQDLYPKFSLTDLTVKFQKSINAIRNRIDLQGIPISGRGGANNVKTEIDRELMDDVVKMGVNKSAIKRGIRPQALYQRLYYKCGVTVKGLRAAADELAKAPAAAPPEVPPEAKPDGA